MEYLSLKESADLLGFNVETLRILMECEMGPKRVRRIGTRPFLKSDILAFRKKMPLSPNDFFRGDSHPLFARHDDGRWWPRLTYEEAVRVGARRYFEGTACEQWHRCERFTKNRQCTTCSEIKAGRGAKLHVLREMKYSSAIPGCNLP